MAAKRLPSAAELREMFSYDPENGELRWKALPPRSKRDLRGALAGCWSSRGYLRVKINKETHRGHRVIWKIVTGEDPADTIDHINGNPSDNRVCNLRPATFSQSAMNTKISCRNRSGVRGVKFTRADNAWSAYIGIGRKRHHLGQFKDFERAVAVRREAEIRLHGEFMRNA